MKTYADNLAEMAIKINDDFDCQASYVFSEWLYICANGGEHGCYPGSALVMDLAVCWSAAGNTANRDADDFLVLAVMLGWITRVSDKPDFFGRGGQTLRAFAGLNGVLYPCHYSYKPGPMYRDAIKCVKEYREKNPLPSR